MSTYPQLKHINLAGLTAAVGGNPWDVDDTLQSGDPGAISDLGRAFINAGACTAETYTQFTQAQKRFRASWNRETGDHPINDSAEVQHATSALLVQRDALPAIGAELSAIAAVLAEAQRFSRCEIENLNGQLHYIDALIDEALADASDTDELEDGAIEVTSGVLAQVEGLRDDYTARLAATITHLRSEHGYDPAAITEPRHQSAGWYDAIQRTQDQALAASPTADSVQKSAAAARLRDYAITTNPEADSDSRRLAGERLDDFQMANFPGQLPRDPVLGGDARDRARSRIDLQRKLEQGYGELPAMTPDQATQSLDDGEQFGRVVATRQALAALRNIGMSREGAWRTVSAFIHQGTDITSKISETEHGLDAYAAHPPGNYVSKLHTVLSPEDALRWSRVAKHLGSAADVVELFTAAADLHNGGSIREACATTGSVLGGWAAGWYTAAMIGGAVNPVVAAGAIVAASIAGGVAGEEFMGGFCSDFDRIPEKVGGRG